MKGISSGFHILFAFIWISGNFFIHNKITLSRSNIYVIFYRSYLTNYSTIYSIPVWQLFLITIERLVKLRVFDNIWNFMINSYGCEISLRISKKSKKCHNSQNIKDLEILINACPTMFYRKELIICFQIFHG